MISEIDLRVDPSVAFHADALEAHLRTEVVTMDLQQPLYFKVIRRSIDARSRQIWVNLRVRYSTQALLEEELNLAFVHRDVAKAPRVIVVGTGPAGLYAALQLIELGIKPILLERGKDVRSRRRDLVTIHREHVVNEDSNYCFGEGGAGTYSDGKLYTRSAKRGNVLKVYEILVQHGASPDILVDAHPHIGTNKLPKIIENIRNTILDCGGEIHFESRVMDLVLERGRFVSAITHRGEEYVGEACILATGHSARDVFELLHGKGLMLEAKPFALGVRVEHPQTLIDRAQYHCEVRPPYLPAATYTLVYQAEWRGQYRGVFTFCMCPGGIIAPAATRPGEVVVNGWSPSARNNKYANSGLVVSIEEADWQHLKAQYGPLAAMHYQQAVEQKAWKAGGMRQSAPAQRMLDFVECRLSTHLPECSYQPGLQSALLEEVLPAHVYNRLREAMLVSGKRIRGYYTNEANIVATESRTSSPVRIPRDADLLCHPQVYNLFPAGEGPGYAGGIVSAAMDGQRVAHAVAALLS